MRYDWYIVGSGKGHYSPCLRHASTPRDIWLKNISTLLLKKCSESVSSILVLPSCYQRSLNSLLQLRITLIIIRWQCFFNPFDVIGFALPGELNSIRQSERHITINHDWEVRPYFIAPLFYQGDVFSHTLFSTRWPIRQGKLGPPKSHLFRQVRPTRRGVTGHLFLGFATQQLVHGHFLQLTQRIPYRQIYRRYGLNRNPLPPIIHSRPPHLIPNQLHIHRILPLHESRQVIFHHETRSFPPYANSHTDGLLFIVQFHLHNDRPQRTNAPGGTAGSVLFVDGHGIGDGCVDDPVA
mmetsp:Transcript_35033/g.64891  ORF Transcript_35033/g.64891 Transcript_35033/m.64891 type:complete len:295 (+) Transcript_35033:334-1218(+)